MRLKSGKNLHTLFSDGGYGARGGAAGWPERPAWDEGREWDPFGLMTQGGASQAGLT